MLQMNCGCEPHCDESAHGEPMVSSCLTVGTLHPPNRAAATTNTTAMTARSRWRIVSSSPRIGRVRAHGPRLAPERVVDAALRGDVMRTLAGRRAASREGTI